MSLPTGTVLFADELRQEITGKFLIIGMYAQYIVFHGEVMPDVMPRLAILCFLKWPDEASVEPVQIECYAPGEPDDAPATIVAQVDPNAVFAAPREDRDEPGIMVAQSFDNIPMGQEGTIRVFVSGASGRRRIGRMHALTHASLVARLAPAVPPTPPPDPEKPPKRARISRGHKLI